MADLRTIVGTERAEGDVRRARRNLDLGQDRVLRKIADHARAGFDANFRTSGRASGQAWPALKPQTVKSKARHRRRFGVPRVPSKPLVLFGDLRQAFAKKGGAQHQIVAGDTLTLAIDQSRVNRHDRKSGRGLGTTKTGLPKKARGKKRYPDNIVDIHAEGRGRVPRRDMTEMPAAAERKMRAEVEEYFDQLVDIMAGLE